MNINYEPIIAFLIMIMLLAYTLQKANAL